MSFSGSVGVSWVAYDPRNPLVSYAITSNPSFLFRSTDAGGSWSLLNPASPGEEPLITTTSSVVAALSEDGQTLFVVNANGTLPTSADGGASWTRLGQTPSHNPSKLILDPAHPGTLYVLDQSDLWRSTDGGQTFVSRVTLGSALHAALDAKGVLYVSDFHQVNVSINAGTTFSPLQKQHFSINALSSVGSEVYLGETVPVVPFVMKLDPTGLKVLYATFFRGSSSDSVTSLALDSDAQAVIGGSTVSPDFPVTLAAATTPGPGNASGFVAKLSADGTRLVYSALISGSKSSSVQAVAVDASGNAYAAGSTASTDLPTTAAAAQPTLPSPCPRRASSPLLNPNTGIYGFVAKLSSDGRAILYTTYLTGACGSSPQASVAGAAGEVFVAGYTTSPDLPIPPGGYQPAFPGGTDQSSPPATLVSGFVAKLSAAGDKVLAGTYLGGGFSTRANAMALDAAGNPTVVGATQGFATGATAGAYQATLVDRCARPIQIGPTVPYTGTGDAFVLQLDNSLSAARFLTYLGGGCDDSAQGIAFDRSNSIWISGTTVSPDFPLSDPFQAGGIPGAGGFVSQLTPNASKLLFSSLSDASTVATSSLIYQAGGDGGSITVSAIDPSTVPAVHIDAIVPKSGSSPEQLTPNAGGIAPGQLVEIKGRNLGPGQKMDAELDSFGRLPFILGGAWVLFGNVPAPLVSVQAESILCFAPFEIAGTAEVQASVDVSRSNAVRVGVPQSAAQILGIANADRTVNGRDHPASLGSTVAVSVSGLGETDPPSADGLLNTVPLAVPVAPVSISLSGMPITPSYAGAAPGLIAGIFQLNVTLPASLPSGVSGDKVELRINSATTLLFVAQ